jgi:hypothetical protein
MAELKICYFLSKLLYPAGGSLEITWDEAGGSLGAAAFDEIYGGVYG